MTRILNDTWGPINISGGALVYSYTVVASATLRLQIYLDTVAGGATDYIAYVRKQRLGAGSSYLVLPVTTGTGIAGVTDISFASISIDCMATDVLDVYVDGQPADVAVSGSIEVFRDLLASDFTAAIEKGDIEYTYTLTNDVTGDPIPDADIWVSTDLAASNIIWRGMTDAFGVARDITNQKPWLDAGIYYFWRGKVGFTFDPKYDIETVSDP